MDSTLVWSSPEGLLLRNLDDEGAPRGPAVRVDAACDGGFDVERAHDGLLVACLRRPTEKAGGAALLLDVRRDRLYQRQIVGHAGRDARGIDLERDSDGWAVAWHDGEPGAWGVWLARVSDTLLPLHEARLLSSPRIAAGRPSLRRIDGTMWVVWSESWIEAGFPHGQIVVWPGQGVPRRVLEVDVLEPSPVLHHDGRSTIVFFRDLRRPHRRVGLFAQRLSDQWRPTGEVVRIGRSDGTQPFHVLPCAGAMATVTPRSWDGDLLLGVNLLDAELRKRVPEQQIYEWSARFATAAARCSGDTLLLIAGEQSRAPDVRVAAHALTLRCH